MANLDFTPLYRSTIGFDSVPKLMQSAMRMSDADVGYTPYNIEKVGDGAYRIVIALAGFGHDDVEVATELDRLTIRGKMVEPDGVEYLHRGIAARHWDSPRVFRPASPPWRRSPYIAGTPPIRHEPSTRRSLGI